MHVLFVLVAAMLAPSIAFACAWTHEPSPPLDYLVAANVFASVAAIYWIMSGPRQESRFPAAIIAASVVAAFGLGVMSEGDNWSDVGGLLGLVPLALPYLAMRVDATGRAKKWGLILGLLLLSVIASIVTGVVYAGTKTGGFQVADPALASQVVF